VATLIRPQLPNFKTIKHKKDLRERAKHSEEQKLDTLSRRSVLSNVLLSQQETPA
jgi:hypothetical protein